MWPQSEWPSDSCDHPKEWTLGFPTDVPGLSDTVRGRRSRLLSWDQLESRLDEDFFKIGSFKAANMIEANHWMRFFVIAIQNHSTH